MPPVKVLIAEPVSWKIELLGIEMLRREGPLAGEFAICPFQTVFAPVPRTLRMRVLVSFCQLT